MGYMGFGLQKWIYSQRPRKPFKKRESPLGHEYIYIEQGRTFPAEGSFAPNPIGVEERIEESKKRYRINSRLEKFKYFIFFIMFLTSIIAIIVNKNRPKIEHEVITNINKENNRNALKLFIETGKYNLEWNNLNSAIEEFERALYLEPNNIEALNYYILALTIDCEQNNRSCDRAIEFFERLKEIDETKIIEGLQIRVELAEIKLEKR
ncbi:MAG: tetratricopeptide repeat protein [Bacteroidales bacterium]